MELNKFSKRVTQDDTQPAAKAMLHAIGLKKEDFKKPFVGVASTGYEGNPCNMHLNDLAKNVKSGIIENNGVGLIFNSIGVSDGISMGTPGMRFSLPSRDIIADSMETVVEGMSYDGFVTVVGCDKNMPGALMAMLRVNRPSILVYGGTIESGFGLLTSIDVSVEDANSLYGYLFLSEVVVADGAGVEMGFGVQDYFGVGGAPDAPMAPDNLTVSVVVSFFGM